MLVVVFGAEDTGKYRASLAISRKTLIPRQEGGIVLLSGLRRGEEKPRVYTVSKEKQRDKRRKE